ncbi:MAG: glycosyltransferase family 4 protein [Acidobacteria bacterium]|nr:glycosyltransferase family 4 protein [Acidobacteriota bacterium]
MRIIWLSRVPWASGGYSNQTEVFAPRLRDAGHEIAIIGYRSDCRGIVDWKGIPVYPSVPNDPRHEGIVARHYEHWRADLLISLHDAQDTLNGAALRQHGTDLNWALWFPVDAEPLSSIVLKRLATVSQPFVFSRFGERVAREAGVDVRFVPHGIDTGIFQPGDRLAARAELGWPTDKFIAGIVAANSGTRKSFVENVQGFARFHRQHPDSLLYLHTQEITPSGIDLRATCLKAGLKVGRDVLFCDPYLDFVGIAQTDLATIYSGIDVLQLVTRGEGFGIPLVEAQACGTPVILGDWSAMSELLFAGWKVEREESALMSFPDGSHWHVPDPGAIADRLAQAYRASREPQEAERLREAAREGALGFDADWVTREYWAPFLAEMEERFAAVPASGEAAEERRG